MDERPGIAQQMGYGDSGQEQEASIGGFSDLDFDEYLDFPGILPSYEGNKEEEPGTLDRPIDSAIGTPSDQGNSGQSSFTSTLPDGILSTCVSSSGS